MTDPESWRDHAECARLVRNGEATVDHWFEARARNYSRLARDACARCPVSDACAQYVLDTPSIGHGLWAGRTPETLKRERARRRREQPS